MRRQQNWKRACVGSEWGLWRKDTTLQASSSSWSRQRVEGVRRRDVEKRGSRKRREEKTGEKEEALRQKEGRGVRGEEGHA